MKLAALLLFLAPAHAAGTTCTRCQIDLTAAQAQVTSLTNQVASLNNQIATTNSANAALQSDLDAEIAANDDLADDLVLVQAQRDQANVSLAALTVTLSVCQTDLNLANGQILAFQPKQSALDGLESWLASLAAAGVTIPIVEVP